MQIALQIVPDECELHPSTWIRVSNLSALRDAYVAAVSLKNLRRHFRRQLASDALRHLRTTMQKRLHKKPSRLTLELAGQFAAIDSDGRTRDEGGLVGSEKHYRLGNLFGQTCALSGTRETNAALLSSLRVNRFSIPVSMGPGATTLTRTPDPATSNAAALVRPSTACLLAA